VNREEFAAWHAKCSTIVETYLAEVRKTATMAENCAPEPLPFLDRFALLSQEIAEQDALATYLEAKRLMHRVAVLGYGAIPAKLPGRGA
jgi:hypothetical protein